MFFLQPLTRRLASFLSHSRLHCFKQNRRFSVFKYKERRQDFGDNIFDFNIALKRLTVQSCGAKYGGRFSVKGR
jgi:hypothetical protein